MRGSRDSTYRSEAARGIAKCIVQGSAVPPNCQRFAGREPDDREHVT